MGQLNAADRPMGDTRLGRGGCGAEGPWHAVAFDPLHEAKFTPCRPVLSGDKGASNSPRFPQPGNRPSVMPRSTPESDSPTP